MDKAVQVGLVFPRSGQQVQVHIPLASAERYGVQHLDPKAPPVLMAHTGNGKTPCKNTTHTR